jgi:hypothetical protein
MHFSRISLVFALSAGVLLAEEAPKKPTCPSPNKRYELRSEEELKEGGIAIVDKKTKEIVCELPEDAVNAFVAEARVIWAPDSRRFAFNCHMGTRYETTYLFQKKGEKFVAMKSPEAPELSAVLKAAQDAQLKELALPKKSYRRRIWDKWQVTRWLDASTAEVIGSSTESVVVKDENTTDLEAWYLFTLKFDDAGNFKVVKQRPMTAKEIKKATGERED